MKLISFAIAAIAGLACVSGQDSSTGSASPLTPYSNSICDRYAAQWGLNNPDGEYQLMDMLVSRIFFGNTTSTLMNVVVEGLANNALTMPYFNGANPTWRSPVMNNAWDVPGSTLPNFLSEGAVQTGLFTDLKTYFGSALGCSAGNFKTLYAYNGETNQTDIHQNMPISATVFNAFNTQVANAALSFNISSVDVASVGALLNTFGRAAEGTNSVICNDINTCVCIDGYVGALGAACKSTQQPSAATSVSASIVSILMAAAVALFATMRR